MQLSDLSQGQLDVLALEGIQGPGNVPEGVRVVPELLHFVGVVAVVVGVNEHGRKFNLFNNYQS